MQKSKNIVEKTCMIAIVLCIMIAGKSAAHAMETARDENVPANKTIHYLNKIVQDVKSGSLPADKAALYVSKEISALSEEKLSEDKIITSVNNALGAVIDNSSAVPSGKLKMTVDKTKITVMAATDLIANQLIALNETHKLLNGAMEKLGTKIEKQITVAPNFQSMTRSIINFEVPMEGIELLNESGASLVLMLNDVSISLPPGSFQKDLSGILKVSLYIMPEEGKSGILSKLPADFYKKMTLHSEVIDVRINIQKIKGKNEKIQLLKPAKIAFTYNPSVASDYEFLGIYMKKDKTDEWSYVKNKADLSKNTLTYDMTGTSVDNVALMSFVRKFDDTINYWAVHEIRVMAARHIVAGADDVNYAPDKTITRARYTVMMARVLGLKPMALDNPVFTDIKPNVWYAGIVEAAAKAGLVYGANKSRFMPDAPMTREQLAAMTKNMLSLQGVNTAVPDDKIEKILSAYKDRAGISPWARESVAFMLDEGYMNGRGDGIFAASGKSTNAEAAVVLYRVMKKTL